MISKEFWMSESGFMAVALIAFVVLVPALTWLAGYLDGGHEK